MTSFELEIRACERCCVLSVNGEIDVACAERMAVMGLLGLSNADAETLVVDLSGVPFMGAAGLGTLVRLRNAALERSGRLQVRGASDRIQSLFHITGLGDVFGDGRRDSSTEPTSALSG